MSECKAHQIAESLPSEDSQVCACQNGFTEGAELECICSDILSLDGSSCGNECNWGEEAIDGRCQCKEGFSYDESTAECAC